MTELLYTGTAPVFRVDGELKGELARDLLRLDVAEDTRGMKRMQAHFIGIGPASSGSSVSEELQYVDGAILDFGKALAVSLGPPDEERTVFEGSISASEVGFQEGQIPLVSVFAEDKLMELRMTRRMKTYEKVTDADIAQSIASEHGIQAAAAADGPTYDVVHQWNQGDLAFLRERAALVQAEIWFADGTLHFKTRANRAGTKLTLVQGNELIAAELRADLAHQRTKVKLSGFDAAQRDLIDEEAGSDAISGEVSGGQTGPAVLQKAFGERASYLVRGEPLVAAEATAWCRAEMLRRSRAFVTVVGITSGSPDMVVGSTLTLERVGRPFEGDGYYVTRVHHSWDHANGHRTRFEAERPTIASGGGA